MTQLLGQYLLLELPKKKSNDTRVKILPVRYEASVKSDGKPYCVGDEYVMPDGRKTKVACVLRDGLDGGNGLLASLLGQHTNATTDPKNECSAMTALSALLCESYNQGAQDVISVACDEVGNLMAKHAGEMAKGWAVVDKLKSEHEGAMSEQVLYTAGVVEASQKLKVQLTFMEARAMKAEEELAKLRADANAVAQGLAEANALTTPPDTK